ncbi:MAG: hypothetical protein OXO50_18790 [Caldilineaceae bacterium]|nr:hypothetical protein [Caldilineaceae bacterium]
MAHAESDNQQANASESLIDALSNSGRPFTAEDDDLHPAVPADNPAWGETSWWAFNSPKDNLIVWVYLMNRRALGVASVGVWVWDNTKEVNEHRDLLYSKWCMHVPIPADGNLSDLIIDFPGFFLEMKALEPLSLYTVKFKDADELLLDLGFRGIHKPEGMGIAGDVGHGDQIGWSTGEVKVYGRSYDIEGPAFRDRSWSERSELPTGNPTSDAWAGDGKNFGFSICGLYDEKFNRKLTLGFVVIDGVASKIVKGERKVVRDPDGSPRTITISATDKEGRDIVAIGERISTASLPTWAGLMCWITQVKWTIGDRIVYGEEHEGIPVRMWRSLRIEGHPAVT